MRILTFEEENEYFTNYSYPCCLHGVWKWSILWGGGGGGMIVVSMYPTSRIVVKPINCEYTSILDNMLLLRTLRYDFCKCSVILEHRYVYTKHILNSTFIATIEVCFIQMQCVIEALICIFKTFLLNSKFLYCFKCLPILIKTEIYHHRVERCENLWPNPIAVNILAIKYV